MRKPASAYAENIRRLRARNPKRWTYAALGAKYGISRQRAHQIAHERVKP